MAATRDQGYTGRHRRLRDEWAPEVAGGRVRCARCGWPISPAEPWDLGHHDTDRTQYVGPEHRRCNRGAPKRRGVVRPVVPVGPPQRVVSSRVW